MSTPDNRDVPETPPDDTAETIKADASQHIDRLRSELGQRVSAPAGSSDPGRTAA